MWPFKKKDKVELPKYKNVGMMTGTWVVDGVRREVAFFGKYTRSKYGREVVTSGEQIFLYRLRRAQELGFIWDHDMCGLTHYEDGEPIGGMININRVSDISVMEEPYIVTLEIDDD